MKKTSSLDDTYIYKITFIKMKISLFKPENKTLFNRSTRATSMLSLKKMDESTVGTIGNWSTVTLPKMKKVENKSLWAY
jgi:hypothetical protein